MNAILAKLPAHLEERFWSKVNKTETCWLWTGSANNYGYMRIDGHNIRAHRQSWVMYYGEIPEGMYVLHKCDNPYCVRPEHLFLGTAKDNAQDMISKNRKPSARFYSNKLTWANVNDIRLLRFEGLSCEDITYLHNISRQAVTDIAKNRTWRME